MVATQDDAGIRPRFAHHQGGSSHVRHGLARSSESDYLRRKGRHPIPHGTIYLLGGKAPLACQHIPFEDDDFVSASLQFCGDIGKAKGRPVRGFPLDIAEEAIDQEDSQPIVPLSSAVPEDVVENNTGCLL